MIWVRRLFWAALGLAILVAGWTLADRNADPIKVDWYFDHAEANGWWVLLCAFAAGAAAASLFFMFSLARSRLVARRYRKELAVLEAEVHQLRNLPVGEEDEAHAHDPTSNEEA